MLVDCHYCKMSCDYQCELEQSSIDPKHVLTSYFAVGSFVNNFNSTKNLHATFRVLSADCMLKTFIID